jgi:hypothetical protein
MPKKPTDGHPWAFAWGFYFVCLFKYFLSGAQ